MPSERDLAQNDRLWSVVSAIQQLSSNSLLAFRRAAYSACYTNAISLQLIRIDFNGCGNSAPVWCVILAIFFSCFTSCFQVFFETIISSGAVRLGFRTG